MSAIPDRRVRRCRGCGSWGLRGWSCTTCGTAVDK